MKTKRFRLASKKVFLTFPHVDSTLDFDAIFDVIQAKFNQLNSVIIAKENHSDLSLHFHIFIEFKSKLNTENPHYFDFIFNKHGNYQGVRNLGLTLNYITKNNLYKEFLSSYTKESLSLTRSIRLSLETPRSQPLNLFKNDNPALRDAIFQHSTKIETYHRRYQAFLHEQELSSKKHIVAWNIPLLENQPNPELKPYISNILPILHFFNRYMVKSERHYKSPNLLIWSSEPDFGKSSLLNLISSLSPSYLWPTDNWYELYSNDLLQFILWDEFTLISYSQEFLKLLFAGGPLKLPIKGSQIFKKDNPIIFCSSNYSLRAHVFRKYSISCSCSLPNNRTLNSTFSPLCLRSPNCNTTDSALLYYDALCARISEYHLPGPLFPNGQQFPFLWESLKSLLLSSALFEPSPPPSPSSWLPKLNSLLSSTTSKHNLAAFSFSPKHLIPKPK